MNEGIVNPTQRLDGIKVLVVEDEADARDVCAAVLALRGAEVRTAASAREALFALRTFAPSVLVSDLGMPEEDGFALMRAVRASEGSGALVPALAFSAFPSATCGARARAAGFDDYLGKPADVDALVLKIARLVRDVRPCEPSR